jgi:23S rRNA pseudouridine1911/1915/1917 synthase
VHVDRDIVVVDKPAGLLSVADEAGNKETLADYTRTVLRRMNAPGVDGPLGVVHRLDKDTSGLMVFARTASAKSVLADAFRLHEVERVYHAIAHGTVRKMRVETDLILDRGDGLRGSLGQFRRARSAASSEARRAVTYVAPIAGLAGATLVECRLETGRQHQIRIHLSESGHPLVGERVYIRDYAGVKIPASRPMLHARTLGFTHPRSGRPVRFESEPPGDFEAKVRSLSRGG